MRWLPLASLLLLVAPKAWAQTPSGTGTCTTGPGAAAINASFSGSMGISFKDSSGNLQSVQAASVPFVFSAPECQCNTMDLFVEVFLTAALPQGTTGTAELWVGTGCDIFTNRINPTLETCEKLATLQFNQFTIGGAPSTGPLQFPLNGSAALFSPQRHLCNQPTASNQIFIFLFQDPSMPIGQCTLPLTEQTQGPAPPQSTSASSGDGAVTISWQPPSVSSGIVPSFYQILCADQNGNPVPGASNGKTQQYSTCLPGDIIDRKALPTGGSLNTGGGTDAGIATEDLGTASFGIGAESLHPQATAPDGGVVDGGTDAGTGQGPTTTNLPEPFTNLDPRFICSQFIQASGTSYSQRIGGLVNGQTYQFTVLAIDQFGNATPSDLFPATPAPTEDLYRRYYNAGGRASGFCFIATAAWGSYEHPYVKVLRDFRDEVLLPRALGRAFVDWYYAHSPPAADYIADHPAARILTQLLLWPVIGMAALWLYVSVWAKGLFLMLALGLFYRKRLAARLRLA